MTDISARLNAALEGRYHIERELGEGGMATVWLAEDRKHERKVALKVLKPELAAMVGADRFLAEIRTTANLRHPHILPLFDSGEADGFLYYVMPHVDGESLEEKLDREKQLPVDEAVSIARKVSGALEAAHEAGVIHRDIKPANILLEKGEPVVADFGIALALGEAGGGRVTETGLSLGTPHYMSPEQATGTGHLGPATDLYALGCVLYEMLVGDPPYSASTAQAVLGKILTEPAPRASAQRPAVPENVDAVIRTALEKVPADRFGSARDFASALANPSYRGRIDDSAKVESGPGAGSWVRTVLAMTVTAVVVALALSVRGDDTPSRDEFRVLAIDLSDFESSPQVRLSPTGSRLLALSEGQLWTREMSDFTWRSLTGTQGAVTPRWSPDGEWITYTVGDEIRRIAADGGPSSTVFRIPSACSWQNICGSAWGWDGRIWAVTGFSDVLVTPEDGGSPQPLFTPAEGVHYHLPLPLPGGAALLLADDEDGALRWELWDGEEVIPVEGIGHPAAAGNGYVFHQRSDEIWATAWSPDQRAFSGSPIFVAPNARILGAAQDGSILALPIRSGPDARRELVWVDREGRETDASIRPPSGEGQLQVVALSPSGRILWRDEGRLWHARGNGGGATPVPVPEAGAHGAAVLAPDGRRAYVSLRQSEREAHETPIVAIDLQSRSVTALVERGKSPSVSHDGAVLLFDVGDVGEGALRVLDLGTGEERGFTAGFPIESSPSFSPSGPWVALMAQDDPGDDKALWVLRFPEADRSILIERGLPATTPVGWSRDGSRLYFVQNGTLNEVRLSESPEGLSVEGRDYLFRLDEQGVGAGSFFADSAGVRFLLGGLTEGAGTRGRTLMLLQNWRPQE